MPYYVIARVGDLEGPITLPSGKAREFDTQAAADRVASTLQSRVRMTRYTVVKLPSDKESESDPSIGQ